MENNKKLTFLIPNLQAGGMERVMSELLQYFAFNTPHELHLVMYGVRGINFYEVPDQVIVHEPAFDFNNNKRLLYTLKTLLYLRKTINSLKPDAVLSFGEYWNNFVLLALRGTKHPVIVSDRSQPDKSLSRVHNFLRKKLYPKAKAVICQTKKAQHIYEKMYRHPNFVIIGNPIKALEMRQDIPKENVVLSVGRLIESKHFDELIDIFADINPQHWKLIIVGDNALKQDNMSKLNQQIKDLGMQDQIKLVGRQSDVDSFYNKSKIFAFTSSSEGFPNVLGEAMSAGLPVVSYDCTAGPSDLIDDGVSGFLTDVHDKSQFKIKLEQLIKDDELREKMGENASEKIKKFNLTKIGQKFEAVLLSSS